MILPTFGLILGSLLTVSYRLYKLSRQLERIETRLLKAESRIVGNNIEIANMVLKDFKRELQMQRNV